MNGPIPRCGACGLDRGGKVKTLGPWRVALVDGHDLVRMGLRTLIAGQLDMSVGCQSATGADALASVPHHADIAILGIRLPDGSGLDICRQIRARDPHVSVMIFTIVAAADMVAKALDYGASAYVLKSASASRILEAIRTVAEGGLWFSPEVAETVQHHLRNPHAPAHPILALSARERAVVRQIANGKTNPEIARELGLSNTTVKHYVSSLLGKLGLEHRAEAAALFARYREEHGSREETGRYRSLDAKAR